MRGFSRNSWSSTWRKRGIIVGQHMKTWEIWNLITSFTLGVQRFTRWIWLSLISTNILLRVVCISEDRLPPYYKEGLAYIAAEPDTWHIHEHRTIPGRRAPDELVLDRLTGSSDDSESVYSESSAQPWRHIRHCSMSTTTTRHIPHILDTLRNNIVIH